MMNKMFFSLIAVLFIAGCGSQRSADDGIYLYDAKLDRPVVAEQLTIDRFWLVGDEMTGYDPISNADTGVHAYTKKPVTFLVYQMDGKTVGFISFYKKTNQLGVIQFLDVVPAYRSKGIARKLMLAAIDKLRTMGAEKVEIVVRLINKKAIELYGSVGFIYAYSDSKYAWYEKTIRAL